jgi:hypothetical protein
MTTAAQVVPRSPEGDRMLTVAAPQGLRMITVAAPLGSV